MSEPTKAVFLSYAHEDGMAARRIAEALRAAAVEVWFDQSELRGGDAWDQKIRQQIKECALFIPIVSANTQERGEGYFRLEWKLAVERTHQMAEGIPFLTPVALDRSHEADALVPPEFMRVHWTRLADGEPTKEFVGQIKRILDAPRKSTAMRQAESAGSKFVEASSASVAPLPAAPPATAAPMLPARIRTSAKSHSPLWFTLGLIGVVAAVLAYVALRPGAKESAAVAKAPVAETKTASALLPASLAPPASPVAGASDKSIAVLPFANRSPDKANEFFTDGVQDDIITNLFNIRELRVVSRTSVEQYRGTTKTMKQIGTELGVAYLLEGSVQRVGDKVHVTGQLIDARTDAHLWAKSFDKDLSDIFVIQAELAKAIATELQAVLSPEEQKLIEQKLTDNPKAYDLYLEAGAELLRVGNTRAARERAVKLDEAAVELDPKFAAAWSALSGHHGYIYGTNWDHTPARLAKVKAALDRVEQLAHGSPLAIGASANYYYTTRDYARSLEQFESLALLQPNNGTWQNQIAVSHRRLGQWTQALVAIRKAIELSPEGIVPSGVLAQVLEAGRRFAEADAEDRRWLQTHPDAWVRYSALARRAYQASGSTRDAEKIMGAVPDSYANSKAGIEARKMLAFLTGSLDDYLRLDALKPNDAFSDWTAGPALGLQPAVVLMARGDTVGARARLADVASLRTRLEAEPDNDVLWAQLGEYEALLGNKESALRCARKAVELLPESRDAFRGPTRSVSLAFVYAWTGDKDRAIAEYARLLRVPFGTPLTSEGNDTSSLNIHQMKRSPVYAPLRGDPRFEALLNDPKNNAPLF